MVENRDVDREKLLEEWKALFVKEKNYYIYGAANIAKQMLMLAKDTEVADKIKGFAVTSEENNPNALEGIPVIDIHKIQDKDAVILVPHVGVFKEEIFSLLKSLDFSNVFPIRKFYYLVAKEAPCEIVDIHMKRAKEQERRINAAKTCEEKEKDELLREQIREIRQNKQPDFGQLQFYQSFERIGVVGTRPSLYRIGKYELEDFLNNSQSVLDIGCNTGFLDMTISPFVKTVTGIEYDKALVDIANHVKEYLCTDNCTFINKDFHVWYQENQERYDVIFSFAIHHWLNIEPEEYAKEINMTLKKKGYLCFESHDLSVPDKEFDKCLETWINMGYSIKKQGEIKDDGITLRKYVILCKPE